MNQDDNNPKPMLCIHVDKINTHYKDSENVIS